MGWYFCRSKKLERDTTRSNIYSLTDDYDQFLPSTGHSSQLRLSPEVSESNSSMGSGSSSNKDNRKLLNNFYGTTSAHGFPQLKNASGDRINILVWHLIIFLAFACLSFHLYTLISKYLKYDYDETTTLVFESPVFPDVTLCNMDAINARRLAH